MATYLYSTLVIVMLSGIILSGMQMVSSNLITLKEGDPAALLFHFNFVPDVDIQIRIGEHVPFYRHKSSSRIDLDGLKDSQAERFNVKVREYMPGLVIAVEVNISEVRKEDEGVFICDMLKNGRIIREHTRQIGVTVYYPPGKATCRQKSVRIDTSDEVWGVIECSASIGTEPGLIECYQNSQRVPPWTVPRQSETTLLQTLWMMKTTRIFCCASTFDKTKGICHCNDYIWDPATQINMIGLNPCPPAEHENTTPDTKNGPTSSIPTQTIKSRTIPSEDFEFVLKKVYNIFGLSCFSAVILFLIVIDCAYTRYSSRLLEKDNEILRQMLQLQSFEFSSGDPGGYGGDTTSPSFTLGGSSPPENLKECRANTN